MPAQRDHHAHVVDLCTDPGESKTRARDRSQRAVFKVVATLCVAVVGVMSFIVLVLTVRSFF